MANRMVELLGIGAGPANLGVAVALEELAPDDLARGSLLVERAESVAWQSGMLLPWAQSQVSFLKDLVTLRNPRSRFSFLNYLHSVGRLDEFVNLGTFTPYRVEISDYLRWVAQSLERVRIEFGRRCTAIEPQRNGAGDVVAWRTELEDGSTIQSRYLVIGVGRDANVPAPFDTLPADRVVHSTRYLSKLAELLAKPADERPERIVVIGGGQSSAEMFASVLRELPQASVTLCMRSVGLNLYQTSKFTNMLYAPSFVDNFYSSPVETREQILREMHTTNYAGLQAGFLDELYRELYLRRLNGDTRVRIRTLTDVTAAQLEGDEVVLTLRDRTTGRTEEIPCDLVLLGTGFQKAMPTLVRQLAERLGLRTIQVNRRYRLLTGDSGPAACYLQGVNEATHGIADSLLSVIGPRSAEIVEDLLAHSVSHGDADRAAVPVTRTAMSS